METKPTTSTDQRPGWLPDGRVDITAVQDGTADLADAPAILESLCDEVEALRAEVAALRGEDETGPEPYPWRITLSTGYEVGRFDYAAAIQAARELHRPGRRSVVRIDGPEGSVPLSGSALERALRTGGAR